jgi:predicted nucleic acid-binding protein
VKRWLSDLPTWLQIRPVGRVDASIQLGQGETEAISLALEHQFKVVLMDERRGRQAAEARGLIAVGTLNILDIADEFSEIDGLAALTALRKTNFRAEADLLAKLEARFKSRRP